MVQAAAETAELLSSLIKADTTNPPGNEILAARVLSEWLDERGVSSQILESGKDRGNLVARIDGEGTGPSLLLLSHLDVVAADATRWKHPPFSGLVADGYVWGRGAIDMKSMTAIEAKVFADLASENERPKGDLILAATAGEERGGIGAKWLLENARDKVMADYVINEGGGEGVKTRSGWLFNIQAAEKGVFWYQVRTKGVPAHGSRPGLGVNAIIKMNSILNKLKSYEPSVELSEYSRGYVEAFLRAEGLLDREVSEENLDLMLQELARREKGVAEYFRSMTRVTMAPTVVKGGVKENIIPHECELTVDCRVPIGYDREGVQGLIERVLSGSEYKLEFLDTSEPTWSPTTTALYDCMRRALLSYVPDAEVVSYLDTGGTDSRFFRRLGAAAYGFQPFRIEGSLSDWARLIHGDDERISLENLEFGHRVLMKTVRDFMWEGEPSSIDS